MRTAQSSDQASARATFECAVTEPASHVTASIAGSRTAVVGVAGVFVVFDVLIHGRRTDLSVRPYARRLKATGPRAAFLVTPFGSISRSV
jgi:hypothetical protein